MTETFGLFLVVVVVVLDVLDVSRLVLSLSPVAVAVAVADVRCDVAFLEVDDLGFSMFPFGLLVRDVDDTLVVAAVAAGAAEVDGVVVVGSESLLVLSFRLLLLLDFPLLLLLLSLLLLLLLS